LTRQKDIYSDIYSFSKKSNKPIDVLLAGSAGEGAANSDDDDNDDDDDDDDSGGNDDGDCDGDGRAPRGGSGVQRRRWGRRISSLVIRGTVGFVRIPDYLHVNNTIILEYNLGGKWIVQSSYVCN
jgi:hypothetical protein